MTDCLRLELLTHNKKVTHVVVIFLSFMAKHIQVMFLADALMERQDVCVGRCEANTPQQTTNQHDQKKQKKIIINVRPFICEPCMFTASL